MKLNIKIDETVLNNAKLYAREKNTDVSTLIENYLASLVSKKDREIEITPLVKSLIGVITLPEDFDVKKFRR